MGGRDREGVMERERRGEGCGASRGEETYLSISHP